MKILTCASYLGSGSSAITNFLTEFSNCSLVGTGNFEMRFIHDPYGIRDLEYNLIENNNRHNTSHAIKKFKKYVTYLNGGLFVKRYRKYFGDNFIKYSNEYINNITELCCPYCWHYDRMEKGKVFDFVDLSYRKICRIFNPEHFNSLLEFTNEKGYFSAIDKEIFYKYTKEYIKNILKCAKKENTEYIVVDQLLPPSNLSQYMNYFDYIKVFIVDRDPRDIFLSAANRWKVGSVPYKNVEDFCKWYEITRRHRKKENINNENAMYIQFEDMIYKYEEITSKIIEFSGINSKFHVDPKSIFNPDVSVKNTNLILQYPKYQREVEFIEKYLDEYLYDFSIK